MNVRVEQNLVGIRIANGTEDRMVIDEHTHLFAPMFFCKREKRVKSKF